MIDFEKFYRERYPFSMHEYAGIIASDSFIKDRIGRVVGEQHHIILNEDGIWDYWRPYFYFPSEEALIIFKMRYM